MSQLVNAEAMHASNPDTFHVQPLEVRNNLPVGSYAKVCLEHDQEGGERFWVEITEAYPNGCRINAPGSPLGRAVYRGRIANEIDRELWELGVGDTIRFGAEHVYDTMPAWVARGGLVGWAKRGLRRLVGI